LVPLPAQSCHGRLRASPGRIRPIIPRERAIKQWVPDDEPLDLWDQTAGFSNDWNQSRPDPKLSEVDLGDGRILVPCFD